LSIFRSIKHSMSHVGRSLYKDIRLPNFNLICLFSPISILISTYSFFFTIYPGSEFSLSAGLSIYLYCILLFVNYAFHFVRLIILFQYSAERWYIQKIIRLYGVFSYCPFFWTTIRIRTVIKDKYSYFFILLINNNLG
jgi:hypothetical protein